MTLNCNRGFLGGGAASPYPHVITPQASASVTYAKSQLWRKAAVSLTMNVSYKNNIKGWNNTDYSVNVCHIVSPKQRPVLLFFNTYIKKLTSTRQDVDSHSCRILITDQQQRSTDCTRTTLSAPALRHFWASVKNSLVSFVCSASSHKVQPAVAFKQRKEDNVITNELWQSAHLQPPQTDVTSFSNRKLSKSITGSHCRSYGSVTRCSYREHP